MYDSKILLELTVTRPHKILTEVERVVQIDEVLPLDKLNLNSLKQLLAAISVPENEVHLLFKVFEKGPEAPDFESQTFVGWFSHLLHSKSAPE